MNLKNLTFVDDKKVSLEVAGNLSTDRVLQLEVSLPEEDVYEAKLWHLIMAENLRRNLIREKGKVDEEEIDLIRKQYLVHPKMKSFLRGHSMLWNGETTLEDALEDWVGDFSKTEVQETDYEAFINQSKEKFVEVNDDKHEPLVTIDKSSPSGVWAWLLPVMLLMVAGIAYLAWPVQDKPEPYAIQLERLQNTMLSYWGNCLKIADQPEKSLKDLVSERDYKLLFDDYRLKVKKIIIDYSPEEPEPLSEAVEYLKKQKRIIDNFCGCDSQVVCN